MAEDQRRWLQVINCSVGQMVFLKKAICGLWQYREHWPRARCGQSVHRRRHHGESDACPRPRLPVQRAFDAAHSAGLAHDTPRRRKRRCGPGADRFSFILSGTAVAHGMLPAEGRHLVLAADIDPAPAADVPHRVRRRAPPRATRVPACVACRGPRGAPARGDPNFGAARHYRRSREGRQRRGRVVT